MLRCKETVIKYKVNGYKTKTQYCTKEQYENIYLNDYLEENTIYVICELFEEEDNKQ